MKHANIEELVTELAKTTYPLWCVDSQDTHSERPRTAPFTSREAAEEAREHDDDLIRRCRRFKASEIPFNFDAQIVEELDEQACSGELPETASADFDEPVVVLRKGSEAEARAAFNAWADKYLVVKAYVCEGDE